MESVADASVLTRGRAEDQQPNFVGLGDLDGRHQRSRRVVHQTTVVDAGSTGARCDLTDRIVSHGTVHINETTNYWDQMAPFGGAKKSGAGRELSTHILDAMSETKQITWDVF